MTAANSLSSYAANDPGHDTLYIEETGDSELTGSFNVSENMRTKGNQTVSGLLYEGSNLDIRGDGDETGSKARIIGAASFLSFQSPGHIFINTQSGTTSSVFFGNGEDSVNINLTGALYFGTSNELDIAAAGGAANSDLYWGDKLLCNASESNCGWGTSAAGGGDITKVQTPGIYIYNGSDTGDVYLLFNESKLNDTIDARDGNADGCSNCLNANEIEDIYLFNTGDTATGNYTFGSTALHIDDTNDRVGIGTATPSVLLQIEKNPDNDNNFTALLLNNDGGWVTNQEIRLDFGTAPVSRIASYSQPGLNWGMKFYTNTGGNISSTPLLTLTNESVGIGTPTPDALLDIQSSTLANQLRVSYDDSNYGNISVNSGGNMTISATGHVIIDLS